MHTVVVGGGFGGIKTALELSQRSGHQVTLISSEDTFVHHAMLPLVAVGMAPDEARFSIAELFADHDNVEFIHARLESIDVKSKTVQYGESTLAYDSLVLALGSGDNYFDMKDVERYAHSIGDVDKAKNLYMRLNKSSADLKVAVVGGGCAGVELAAALATHLKGSPGSGHGKSRVALIEASGRLLPGFSYSASESVERRLDRLGVAVYLGESVEGCSRTKLTTSRRVLDKTATVWTAGVKTSDFYLNHPEVFSLSLRGRVEVGCYLEAAEDVYVIGDNAEVPDAGTAKSALRMAGFVARNIDLKYKDLEQREYSPGVYMTTIPIGENWSYIERYGIFTTGMLAQALRKQYELKSFRAVLPNQNPSVVWEKANTLKKSI